MKKLLFPILLLIAAPAFADEPAHQPAPPPPPAPAPQPQPAPPEAVTPPILTLPPSVTAPVGVPVVIAPIQNTGTVGGTVRWMLPDGGLDEVFLGRLFDEETAKKAVGRVFYGSKPGRYRVWAVCAKGGVVSQVAQCFVEITGPPTPVPPVPPGPTPPVPPGPTPGPVRNGRVLITFDSATLTRLPAAQQNVLYSQSVRDVLDAATPAGADGKTHQWRIWPADSDPSAEGGVWPDLVKRPKASQPWVVIAGDAGVSYEGPLPQSTAEMVALVQKYLPK